MSERSHFDGFKRQNEGILRVPGGFRCQILASAVGVRWSHFGGSWCRRDGFRGQSEGILIAFDDIWRHFDGFGCRSAVVFAPILILPDSQCN